MQFRRTTLCVGALLLIAAQEAPEQLAAPAEPADAVVPPEAPEVAGEAPTDATGAPSEAGAPADASEPSGETDAAATDVATAEAAATSNESALPPEEAPTAIAVPARGEPPTKEFMVGVWTEDLAKCSSALDFKADGTLIGPFPRWDLTDGVLTMTGSRQKIWLTVIDQDTMQSRRSETDPPRTLKRCPASGQSAG